jgi:hypothetical protein
MNNPNQPAKQSEKSTPVNPVEWQRQLHASPGYHANALIATVKRYSYILQRNIAEFNALINTMQDPAFAIPLLAERDKDPRRHEALLGEAERLLHNVMMAIKTRIDLLRVLKNKYFADDESLLADYSAEVAQIFNSDSARFLTGLRNHMTHHLLPVTRSHFHISAEGPFTFTIILDAQALLEWDWDSASVRQWIEQQSPDVMIAEVVNDYGDRARRFDKWLIGKIIEKYETELSEFETALEAYTRAMTHFFGV